MRVTREAYAALTGHAAADYPAEAVGLLIGPAAGPVTGTHPLVNEEADARGVRYRVGPAALAAAHGELAAAGRDVLGVYHSHCDRSARLSDVDRSGARPGVLHVVVAVHGPAVHEVRAWRRAGDGPEAEVPIEVLP